MNFLFYDLLQIYLFLSNYTVLIHSFYKHDIILPPVDRIIEEYDCLIFKDYNHIILSYRWGWSSSVQAITE